MREILFRGKRKDNGEWAYGSYHSCVGVAKIRDWGRGSFRKDQAVNLDRHWILKPNIPDSMGWSIGDTFLAREVIPETAGQFTNLNDKNGAKIFGGDKVKRRVWIIEGEDYMDYTCDVKWNGWSYALFIHDKQVWGLDPIFARECEVIGNIHTAQ